MRKYALYVVDHKSSCTIFILDNEYNTDYNQFTVYFYHFYKFHVLVHQKKEWFCKQLLHKNVMLDIIHVNVRYNIQKENILLTFLILDISK